MLVGCTTRMGGSPVTTTGREAPTDGSAAAMLGELTTIDPCGLTDLDVFDEFGVATFAVPESFDYCAIDTAMGSADVRISLGALDTLTQPPEATTKRVKDLDDGMYVSQLEPTERYCSQDLVFADQIALRVDAYEFSDAPPELCPMVSAAMDKVVDVVEHGRVRHRVPEHGSLIPLDACSMISDDTVTSQAGFADARRHEYPARHQCRWLTPDGPDRFTMYLSFEAGSSPGIVGDAGRRTSIAGREAFVNPFPEIDNCSVTTGHIIFDEIPEHDLALEQVEVQVLTPPGRVDDGCQAAIAVANEVWPQLPTP
jgi:hypothetical protein